MGTGVVRSTHRPSDHKPQGEVWLSFWAESEASGVSELGKGGWKGRSRRDF